MAIQGIDQAARVYSIAGYEPVSRRYNHSSNNWTNQLIVNRANPRDFARLFPYQALLLAFSEASHEIWRSSQVADRAFHKQREPMRRQQLQREAIRKSILFPPTAIRRHWILA